MKTTLTDNQINVINLPKWWKYPNFDINADMYWNIEIKNESNLCTIKIIVDALLIHLTYKENTFRFDKTDFNKVHIDLKSDSKNIIKPESLEINFEKKHITIS